MLVLLSLCGSQLLLSLSVEDVDLAFLKSREDIKRDKEALLNDSEWELFSVSSRYNILQSSTGDFSLIQFHVGLSPSCPCCLLFWNLWLSLLRNLYCIFSFIIIQEPPVQMALDIHLHCGFSETTGLFTDPGLVLSILHVWIWRECFSDTRDLNLPPQ